MDKVANSEIGEGALQVTPKALQIELNLANLKTKVQLLLTTTGDALLLQLLLLLPSPLVCVCLCAVCNLNSHLKSQVHDWQRSPSCNVFSSRYIRQVATRITSGQFIALSTYTHTHTTHHTSIAVMAIECNLFSPCSL